MTNYDFPGEYGTCPVCLVNWDGGRIYPRLREMEEYAQYSDEKLRNICVSCYGSEDAHFSNCLSIISLRKDRVTANRCPACRTEWDADTGKLTVLGTMEKEDVEQED